MYIVPYLYKKTVKQDRTFHVIDILTEGGQKLWTEAETVDLDADILEPNSLVTLSRHTDSKTQFLALDPAKTDLLSMYKWAECPVMSDTLCWRTFYVITDMKGNPWIQIPDSVFKPVLTNILMKH
jgi:hypothetical protein